MKITARLLAVTSILFLLCTFTTSAPASEIHVPADYLTIQAALDAAGNGDTVTVADGTWTGAGNRDLVFNGREVLLRSANGAATCTIDCQGSEAEPHRAFVFETGEGPLSVVQGFQIINGYADRGGAIICDATSPTILDCVISGNTAQQRGGGISCHYGSAALISGCTINSNSVLETTSTNGGGGISLIHQCAVRLENCRIEGNSGHYGGGIKNRSGCSLEVENCVIASNQADLGGAQASIAYADTHFVNCLIYGNTANQGGGIYVFSDFGAPEPLGGAASQTDLSFCTLAENQGSPTGTCILMDRGLDDLQISNTIVWGSGSEPIDPSYAGDNTIAWSDIQGGYDGTGNINQDPLFASGPRGDFYLGQTAAGQAADSPCVDAGNPGVAVPSGTTRTDSVQDTGVADMGYHYEPGVGGIQLVTGPGPATANPTLVRTFPPVQDASMSGEFTAYGVQKYGVNVSCGDVDGNGRDEILTGAGPGAVFGPHVRGFVADGTPLTGLSFLAYGTPRWGVNVTVGDLDGDGTDEIVTGAGPGAVFGPHVRAFAYDGAGVTPLSTVSFFAYGTLKWGANVACGDIDGDGMDEIVTGAGPGAVFGPHVRGWNVDGGVAAPIAAVSYMAYGTNKYGVRVSCGDVDGDGIDEIVTAPGPSPVFGADIRGWNCDGGAVQPLPGLSFFAWPATEAHYGASVHAGMDLDGDGRDDLLVGGGPDPALGTELRVFHYQGQTVSSWFSLTAYDPGVTHGVRVAAGRF